MTPHPATSLDRWIERWADSERVALVFEEREITYRRLSERIASTAGSLSAAGVAKGERVAFCGLNRPELFECLFACARIGAIFCPVNNRLTPGEVATQLADCTPSLLLGTDGFDELLAAAAAASIEAPVRDLDNQPVPDEPVAASATPPPPGEADAAVLMVYTSGTTGRPKGAVLDQGALLHTCLNSIDHQDLDGDDCVIAPLPTFHVGGLNIQTLPTLLVGGRVLLQRRFDPAGVLDLIRHHRPTQTLLVPAMLAAVAAEAEFATTDLSCLDGINTGSSIVPEAAMAPYFERGVPVGQVYGTTESGPTAVVLRYDEAAANIGSCGRPATHTDVRLVDQAGVDCGDDQQGEIWLRGSNLFSHYWNDEAATKEAFVDGWYRTGDIGYRRADGYLHITDRLTDVIISGGENVYPAELEAILIDHPAIVEVAVVGRAHERWGETPVAAVVLGPGHDLGIDQLRAWCQDRLARYKQPRELAIFDELPRTALGKVRKHVLRGRLPAAPPPDW